MNVLKVITTMLYEVCNEVASSVYFIHVTF
jgi:hypothetical protein